MPHLLILISYLCVFTTKGIGVTLPKLDENKEHRIAILDLMPFFASARYRGLSNELFEKTNRELKKILRYTVSSQEQVYTLFSRVLEKNNREWRESGLNEIDELAAAGNISMLLYAKSDFQLNDAREFNISVKLYFAPESADITLGNLTGRLDQAGIILPIDGMVRLISQTVSRMLGKEPQKSALGSEMILLLAPKYNNNNELSELQKQTAGEQNFVIDRLRREHGYNLVYYAEFLRNNNIRPFQRSEGKLANWIKKNDIQRILYMKVKTGLVTLINVVEGRPKRKVTFDVDTPSAFKSSKINEIARGFYIEPKIKIETINELSNVSVTSWRDVSFEIGFNPFYQFILAGDTRELNFLGGGFLIHMRAPIASIFNIPASRTQTSSDFSRSLFFGLSLHSAYVRENLIVRQTLPVTGVQADQSLTRWFQNYTIAFEVSYLYPVTPSFRAGLSLRPGYHIGFFGNTLTSSPSEIYRNFALYSGLEANFLITQGLSLNLGIGYSTHSTRFAFHGFYSSLGISFIL